MSVKCLLRPSAIVKCKCCAFYLALLAHNAIVMLVLLVQVLVQVLALFLLHFPTRKITFLRSTAVMWLLFHWLSPLSPHLIYGIRCLPQDREKQQQQQQQQQHSQLENFTNFWHTVATTMAMTTAIAAAVCSAAEKRREKRVEKRLEKLSANNEIC